MLLISKCLFLLKLRHFHLKLLLAVFKTLSIVSVLPFQGVKFIVKLKTHNIIETDVSQIQINITRQSNRGIVTLEGKI